MLILFLAPVSYSLFADSLKLVNIAPREFLDFTDLTAQEAKPVAG